MNDFSKFAHGDTALSAADAYLALSENEFDDFVYVKSIEIIGKMADGFDPSFDDFKILRQAWENGRHGNDMRKAFSDADTYFMFTEHEFINRIIRCDGFLSKTEIWHSQRMKSCVLYRGCDASEIDEPGYSWTTSENVAEFFARRNNYVNPVVLTGYFDNKKAKCGLLLNAEKEIICTDMRVISAASLIPAYESD